MRRLLLSSLPLLLAATVPCQALELDVRGGSSPGTLAFDVYPGLYPLEAVAIAPSYNRGPTPLSLIDPNDPRSLDIGADLLSAMWLGFTGLDGHVRFGPYPMGTLPAFQDLAIYFQAVTIQGWPTIVDRISHPNVVRLGNAGAFRDRQAYFQDDRAFATVLPRADHTWMLVGGARGALLAQNAHDTTAIYDPLDDAFVPGPMLSTPRSMHTQTLLPDGRWLIAGGVNGTNDPQATCEVYDPAIDAFTPVASMLVPRMGHTATLLANGKVLVTGGLQAVTVTPTALSAVHDATNTTELYDPLTDTWTAGPNLRTPRAAHASILRPDGKVLVLGGISWDTVIILGWLPAVRATTDLYDPVANTITAGPTMASARSLVEPLALGNNRWLLAGGINSLTLTNLGTSTASAEIYDAVANTWTTVGSMGAARAYHRGFVLDATHCLMAGGASGTILSPVPSASTEIFSTVTNTWTPGPAMTIPRAGQALFATPQGQIHVFGGGSTNNAITNSTEFYYF